MSEIYIKGKRSLVPRNAIQARAFKASGYNIKKPETKKKRGGTDGQGDGNSADKASS